MSDTPPAADAVSARPSDAQMTAPDPTDAATTAPAQDDAPRKNTLLEQMGGPVGMLDSGLPVLVFIIINVIGGLRAAIIGAIAAGVVIAVIRLVRKQPVTQAIGGLFAVGVAAYIAHRTGSARGFFLLGIWIYVVYGGALLLSIVARWPLIGVLWEGVNGRKVAWRRDRVLLRRYDFATAVWVGVFAMRFVVQQYLYGSDQVGWLGFARIAMGYPLFVVAILATVAIVGTASGTSVRQMLRRATGRGPGADPGGAAQGHDDASADGTRAPGAAG